MKQLQILIIEKNETIINAIKQLNNNGNRILLVIEKGRLVGVVNDGDIRRWILKNGDFSMPVSLIMNGSPIYLFEEERDKAIQVLRDKCIEAIPIVNHSLEVQDIVFWNELLADRLISYEKIEVPIVIMAGGEGRRLYPYTKILPKPLISINDSTILENIISRFMAYGCIDFYLTLNYKKHLIKAYFADLELNYNLHYIEESKYLGTCGSLHMLKGTLEGTFFVSNCDILVDADYSDILNHHRSKKNVITVITAAKTYRFPYGLIKNDHNGDLTQLEEKPEWTYQINTGLYVLEPEALDYIPADQQFHMTKLIDRCKSDGKRVGIYPVSESAWLDMGDLANLDSIMRCKEGY